MRRAWLLIVAAFVATFFIAIPSASATAPPFYKGTYAGGAEYYTIYGATSPKTSYLVTSTQGWYWAINAGAPHTADAERTVLSFQTDCNLVDRVYDYSGATPRFLYVWWASNSVRANCGGSLRWQTDDNLVIYDHAGHPLWASNTVNTAGGRKFALQDNSYVTIAKCCWANVWVRPT